MRLLWHRIIFSGKIVGGGRSGFSVPPFQIEWVRVAVAEVVRLRCSRCRKVGLLLHRAKLMCANSGYCLNSDKIGSLRDELFIIAAYVAVASGWIYPLPLLHQ